MHSGETNIGYYKTLTPYKKEIHDIETNIENMTYKSHQQLIAAATVNHHSDQQPRFPSVHPLPLCHLKSTTAMN